MSTHRNQESNANQSDKYSIQEEFSDLELLDRLESLREDMEDLGVTTLAEVEQRITALNRKLDALD